MMKRKIYSELLEWKGSSDRKSLVVTGQRQIGKTFIIRQFAEENYSDYVYVDFNENSSVKKLFDEDLDVDHIIRNIEQYLNKDIGAGTLLIFDEIQECNNARASLKYFTIDKRYDVIASGSLLGVDIPNKDCNDHLIPLGYEEHILMYSLDFEEFLWAVGVKQSTIDDIKEHIRSKSPINEAILSKFEEYYRDYMIVGGMPESVSAFVSSKKYTESGKILNDLIKSCRDDIIRYCPDKEKIKTLECLESIPSQLSKSNKKFMYSEIKGDYSRKAFSYYSENLLWIKGAGYGNFCTALDGVALPLMTHEMKGLFRVYLSDTGMLAHMFDTDAIRAIYEKDTAYNFGAVAENAVAEALMKSGIQPRYYKKNSGKNKIELDFVIVLGAELTVIEVKSGKKREAPSLDKAVTLFDIPRKIKLEMGNVYVKDGIEHYPLFAACFIKEMKSPYDGPEF